MMMIDNPYNLNCPEELSDTWPPQLGLNHSHETPHSLCMVLMCLPFSLSLSLGILAD